jgi:hypothetical protein
MKRFLYGLAALPFLAGVSFAAQPVPLNDAQMDRVTAGFDFTELEVQNTGWVAVGVNAPAPVPPITVGPGGVGFRGVPYIIVTNTWFPGGAIAQQTAAGFGPTP